MSTWSCESSGSPYLLILRVVKFNVFSVINFIQRERGNAEDTYYGVANPVVVIDYNIAAIY